MVNQPNHPKRDDAVLGGKGALPQGGVILGGLDGVKKRLLSPVAKHRVATLTEALQYGQKGLTLVVRALRDNSEEVRQAAYSLLKTRPEPIAQQAVERFYTRIQYSRLIEALKSGNWKEADQETRIALFTASGIDPFGQPRPNPYRIAECPCKDLHIVDQLWVQYSRGRFGFSVQQSIWHPLERLYWDKAEVWAQFGDRVGWRTFTLTAERRWKRYEELTFAPKAPMGHLPFLGEGFGIFTIEAISQRLTYCSTNQDPADSTAS